MHRLSSAGLSSVVRTHHGGLCYRVAAAAQSSALSPLPTPHGVEIDVNNNARNSPRMQFNYTLLLGRRGYESTAVELHPPSPPFCKKRVFSSNEGQIEIYKKSFNDHLEPLVFSDSMATTRRKGCATTYGVSLYVPAVPPSGKDDDIINPKNNNIQLYMNNAFVSDDFDGELLPKYLSFVKAVVNTNHPILDHSRQALQKSRSVEYLRRYMVCMTLDMFRSAHTKDYVKLWDNYGKYLKLGCIEDHENHLHLAPVLCFFSSKSDDRMIRLYEYMFNMKQDQNDIYYYIASDSVTSAKNTPLLKNFIDKDLEVLFLVDPIDKVVIENLKSYRGKKFVDITDEDLDIDLRDGSSSTKIESKKVDSSSHSAKV